MVLLTTVLSVDIMPEKMANCRLTNCHEWSKMACGLMSNHVSSIYTSSEKSNTSQMSSVSGARQRTFYLESVCLSCQTCQTSTRLTCQATAVTEGAKIQRKNIRETQPPIVGGYRGGKGIVLMN
jgi:hypothetical protein